MQQNTLKNESIFFSEDGELGMGEQYAGVGHAEKMETKTKIN